MGHSRREVKNFVKKKVPVALPPTVRRDRGGLGESQKKEAAGRSPDREKFLWFWKRRLGEKRDKVASPEKHPRWTRAKSHQEKSKL